MQRLEWFLRLVAYQLLFLATNISIVSPFGPSLALASEAAKNDDDDDDDDENKNDYDPDDEPDMNVCRRNPTWKGRTSQQDYHEECRQQTGWTPKDWWGGKDDPIKEWLPEGKKDQIAQCIDTAFLAATIPTGHHKAAEWTRCNELDRNDACYVPPTKVVGHYSHDDDGEIVIIQNAFTEQEAFGVRALVSCMKNLLPGDHPWVKDRRFGIEKDSYGAESGNLCYYIQGMIQVFLPGVAATMYRNMQAAYDKAGWEKYGPPPKELGLRSAEHLEYEKVGYLGLHDDTDSLFTMSVALANENDYQGGFYHLTTEGIRFKLPRLDGMVFLSEKDHGVTQIESGRREVFVVELWKDDYDTPIGLPRPDPEEFDEYKEKRQADKDCPTPSSKKKTVVAADDDNDDDKKEE